MVETRSRALSRVEQTQNDQHDHDLRPDREHEQRQPNSTIDNDQLIRQSGEQRAVEYPRLEPPTDPSDNDLAGRGIRPDRLPVYRSQREGQDVESPDNTWRMPDGAEIKTYREMVRMYKARKFTSRQFIVQPRSDTRICRISSESEIGRDFVRKFLASPHKPKPFGDHHEDNFAELAACYHGIRLVACSGAGANHIQAELEFRKTDNNGSSEPWTKWLNRGRIQQMLGRIKADREIAQMFTDENQSPPWMKTREQRSLRPSVAPRICSDHEQRLSQLEATVHQISTQLRRLSRHLQPERNQPRPTPEEAHEAPLGTSPACTDG